MNLELRILVACAHCAQEKRCSKLFHEKKMSKHEVKMTMLTFFVSKDAERIRVLMSEKLAHNNVRVLSYKLQVSMVKSLLQPML